MSIFDKSGIKFLYKRFRVVCVHLVPCVSLVILNILLFSAIRKAERRRQKLLASRVKAEQAGLVKRSVTKRRSAFVDCIR